MSRVVTSGASKVSLFSCIVLLIGCSGCSKLDEPQITAIASTVVRTVPEATWALTNKDAPALDSVDVYVDLSKTMSPFAHQRTSIYYQIIYQLHNRLAGQISIHGFGFAPGDSVQTIKELAAPVALLQRSTYDRLNNDYAHLFTGFDDISTTRIVLTDGVQSNRGAAGERAAYAGIVEAARAWLQKGGFFAVMLYRSDYDGTYYPESPVCAGTSVSYSCRRPLLAFVFAPSPETLNQLLHELGTDLAPQHIIRVGGNDLSLHPLANQFLESSAGRRGKPLLRDLTAMPLQNYVPVPTGLVSAQAVDNNGYIPLQFDLRLASNATYWRALPSEQLRQFLSSLKLDVRAWETDPRSDSLRLSPIEVGRQGVTVDVLETSAQDSVVARITVQVRKPADSKMRHFAWLFSLQTADGDALIPADFSTDVDCTREQCPLTLNLRPLLGAILRDYTPGRLLLITEWR